MFGMPYCQFAVAEISAAPKWVFRRKIDEGESLHRHVIRSSSMASAVWRLKNTELFTLPIEESFRFAGLGASSSFWIRVETLAHLVSFRERLFCAGWRWPAQMNVPRSYQLIFFSHRDIYRIQGFLAPMQMWGISFLVCLVLVHNRFFNEDFWRYFLWKWHAHLPGIVWGSHQFTFTCWNRFSVPFVHHCDRQALSHLSIGCVWGFGKNGCTRHSHSLQLLLMHVYDVLYI